MNRTQRCRHGHDFLAASHSITSEEYAVCPVCGAVSINAVLQTRKNADATVRAVAGFVDNNIETIDEAVDEVRILPTIDEDNPLATIDENQIVATIEEGESLATADPLQTIDEDENLTSNDNVNPLATINENEVVATLDEEAPPAAIDENQILATIDEGAPRAIIDPLQTIDETQNSPSTPLATIDESKVLATIDEVDPLATLDESDVRSSINEEMSIATIDEQVISDEESCVVPTNDLFGGQSNCQESSGEHQNPEEVQQNKTRPEFSGFEVLAVLGEGAMGAVYRVRELASGRVLALKTAHNANAKSLKQFKQEFRVVADVVHPNLVSLGELVVDGSQWYFTMELIEGVDFLEYIWSEFEQLHNGKARPAFVQPIKPSADSPRLSGEQLKRLRHALTQLAAGISALHAHGMLHRDIKPANVMVTTDSRLRLLDFGLVELQDETPHAGRLAGTVAYMSPEQAARLPVDEASDWYAVGVMLYETLTGQFPINITDKDALEKKQQIDPPPPNTLVAGVPKDLNDLCMALLSRVPDERFVLKDELDSTSEQSHQSRVEARKSTRLVGRERILETLQQAFQATQGGRTQSLFVHVTRGWARAFLSKGFSKIYRT